MGEVEILQLKLRLLEHVNHLSGGSQHLSFGERNAFAEVLFMYKCIANNSNLIILDDPTSSFIKIKSSPFTDTVQARGKRASKGAEVIDAELIIDTIRSVRCQFNNKVSAAYLKLLNRVEK